MFTGLMDLYLFTNVEQLSRTASSPNQLNRVVPVYINNYPGLTRGKSWMQNGKHPQRLVVSKYMIYMRQFGERILQSGDLLESSGEGPVCIELVYPKLRNVLVKGTG